MRSALSFGLAALLLMSIITLALPVDAQGTIKTQLTLGLKKDADGQVTGSQDDALPSLVRVGETYLIYGRLMQLPNSKNLQALPDAEVKLIDVFNNAQNPIVLATAKTDKDGFFVFEWKVSAQELKKYGIYSITEGITSLEGLKLQVLGVYDGDSTHIKSTSRGYLLELKPLRLNISVKTDKQLYAIDETARVTITFKDNMGQLIDPDTLEVSFESSTISPLRNSVGTYFFSSPPLSENIHKIVVLADKEDYLREIISATITASAKAGMPINFDVKLDQDAYGLGDSVVITGTVTPVLEGRAVLINVANPNGVAYSFGQVIPSADGTFTHEFGVAGRFATAGDWKVTFTYLGSQISNTFSVGELPTKLRQIAIRSSSAVNDKGVTLDGGSLGVPVGIQTELANDERKDIALTYIVQVKDAEGFTVMVSWIKGIVLKPSASMKPAIFWTPKSEGDYSIGIFVWESFENPMALAPPKAFKINVA